MAGSTSFLQWNPGQVNQEDDAAYLADSQRAGGAPNGSPIPAELGNKVFYQATTFIAAFGLFLANQGFVVSDADVNALAAVFATAIVTFPSQRAKFAALTYSPLLTINLALAESFECLLTGDATVTFTGIAPGRDAKLAFLQDGAGGHVVNFPTGSSSGQVQGLGAVDPGANELSLSYIWVSSDGSIRAITGQAVTP